MDCKDVVWTELMNGLDCKDSVWTQLMNGLDCVWTVKMYGRSS